MARKPNLFLIGAMRSGTTYLCKLLDAHPSIFMCRPKEPSYFVDPGQLKTLWPNMWDQGFWRSEDHYLRLFSVGRRHGDIGRGQYELYEAPDGVGCSRKDPEL